MKPNLVVVKRTEIVPLMDFDRGRVEYLVSQIENSGCIRNPFALARVSKGRFLLLEDSSVMEALRRLGIEYVPAQVITFRKTLKFDAGLYAGRISIADLKRFGDMFPRAFYMTDQALPENYDSHSVVVRIHKSDEPELWVYFFKDQSGHLPPALFSFLNYLDHKWSFCCGNSPARVRPVNTRSDDELWHIEGLNINVSDILFAADHGFRFPSRMLKFNCGRRIIGIDYPLDVLCEHVPVAQKEQFLHDLINMRVKAGYSDYFKSGVYLLNY